MRLARKYLLFIFILVVSLPLIAQESILINQKINWEEKRTENLPGGETNSYLFFRGAEYPDHTLFPFLFKKIELSENYESVSIEITGKTTEIIPEKDLEHIEHLEQVGNDFKTNVFTGIQSKLPYAYTYILPIRRIEGSNQFERITSVSYQITLNGQKPMVPFKNARNYKSVLSEGEWHKFGIVEAGVYKISYEDLKASDINVDEINPTTLQLFGNGGGMISETNSEEFTTDLQENAIIVYGEEDGSFDPGDYILFYGDEQTQWVYNIFSRKFNHEVNLYSDTTYYFVTFNQTTGKRINSLSSSTGEVTDTITSFIDYQLYNNDLVSIARTGKEWYGETFSQANPAMTFTFPFPNIDVSKEAYLRMHVAGRSTEINLMTAYHKENKVLVGSISSISPAATTVMARKSIIAGSFQAEDSDINIDLVYSAPTSTSIGWLNYLEINAIRNLVFDGPQMRFRDIESYAKEKVSRFELSGSPDNLVIWDITEKSDVKNVLYDMQENTAIFILNTDTLRQFISFDQSEYLVPNYCEKIENQNIHGTGQVDMVIITHPHFIEQAYELAELHYDHDDLNVTVNTIDKIYNEFSSGAQDISAIRNYIRLLYHRAERGNEPRYLLLLGDGSYDHKNRVPENTNYVPTFQSQESLLITASYVSDDFYGLLDPGEGSNANGVLDIGIGRLPAQNKEEAEDMVQKIKHYVLSEDKILEDWRNIICFVADDEDNNLHFKQAEEQADSVSKTDKNINIEKIYFDSFQQVTTSGGDRYPDANTALNKRVEEGALIVNYTGHGGEEGWSEERVLTIADINRWDNFDHLPFFITATCEFSRYDEPDKTTAGELVLLNPEGGGIGLLTTTRLAFAQSNFNLNKKFYEYVFNINEDQKRYRLGDLIKICKTPPNENIKNHHLLGDPAVSLSFPKYLIQTLSINEKPIGSESDTIKAMQEVTVTGEIINRSGVRETGFNGILYAKVFDKPSRLSTLGNDPKSFPASFTLQNDLIYSGNATVSNGTFTIKFYVPKDIALQFGKGKISFYAQNGEDDARGYYDNLVIGGVYENAVIENTGPNIDLFLNDDRFVSGDVVNQDPVLIAYLSDEHGINFLGNGIGHDIVATIDNNPDYSMVLNNYFDPDTDSFQSGMVLFQYESLAPGDHTLSLKAWDLQNNSNTVTINFTVSDNIRLATGNMLNYPNPFREETHFIFEHNQFDTDLEVSIFIYGQNGDLSSVVGPEKVVSDGYFSNPVTWDGTDLMGNKLKRGIYFYKAYITGNKGSISELSGKVILLR